MHTITNTFSTINCNFESINFNTLWKVNSIFFKNTSQCTLWSGFCTTLPPWKYPKVWEGKDLYGIIVMDTNGRLIKLSPSEGRPPISSREVILTFSSNVCIRLESSVKTPRYDHIWLECFFEGAKTYLKCLARTMKQIWRARALSRALRDRIFYKWNQNINKINIFLIFKDTQRAWKWARAIIISKNEIFRIRKYILKHAQGS